MHRNFRNNVEINQILSQIEEDARIEAQEAKDEQIRLEAEELLQEQGRLQNSLTKFEEYISKTYKSFKAFKQTLDYNIWSDLFKDVYGTRPRFKPMWLFLHH